MDTKRHSTATFDTLRNFNRICLDKSIGSEAVDNNKLMALSLAAVDSGFLLRASAIEQAHGSQLGGGCSMSRPLVKVSGQFPQPTIIKKSSLSHRIAIQQHGMRGSIISILPADEMGCFCISQAYTRSLGSIPKTLGRHITVRATPRD